MDKQIIGRAERVAFPSLNTLKVPAKVDTGADSSSIWCSQIELKAGQLKCVFFGPASQFYTGEAVNFDKGQFDVTRVANSFGKREIRYKVKLPIEIQGRVIKASFTLADRSAKLYPVLIGLSTLRGKFIIDVAKGSPLENEEAKRKALLSKQMAKHKKELGL
jgi:hypothetical protein